MTARTFASAWPEDEGSVKWQHAALRTFRLFFPKAEHVGKNLLIICLLSVCLYCNTKIKGLLQTAPSPDPTNKV